MVTLATLASHSAVLIFLAVMIYVAFVDLTTHTIPNWLIGVLLAAYGILAPLSGLSLQDMGLSAAISAAVLLVTFAFFARGWIGGGDAKLAAATALWLGPDYTLAYLINTALFGGILGISLLMFRSVIIPPSWYGHAWIDRLHAGGAGIPYGVAMAAAAVIAFKQSPWMQSIY